MKLNEFGRSKARRCRICDQELIATCDTTKPAELVEFETGRAGEPLIEHMFYPTAKTQSDLCFRCSRAGRLKPGKDSRLTMMTRSEAANLSCL